MDKKRCPECGKIMAEGDSVKMMSEGQSKEEAVEMCRDCGWKQIEAYLDRSANQKRRRRTVGGTDNA